MPARVADASVIAALALSEETADAADSFLLGFALYEPTLLPLELASTARTKIRRYPEAHGEITVGLALVLKYPYRWIEVDPLEVVHIALETGLSTYDASYVVVAETVGAELVTFDRRLDDAFRSRRHLDPLPEEEGDAGP